MPGCKWQASPLCGLFNGRSKVARRCFQAFHSSPRSKAYDSFASEHAALIDTLSLRNTLESIREANRARLIRKIGGKGHHERLSLPKILKLPERPVSGDAAAIERLERRQRRQERPVDHRPTDRGRVHAAARHITRLTPVDAKHVPLAQRIERARLGGTVAPLIKRWLPEGTISEGNLRPWMARLKLDQRADVLPARERLSREIRTFEEFISPNSLERKASDRVINDLRSILRTMDQRIHLEVVGSRSSGLASPLSDIDVNIFVEGQKRFDTVRGRGEAIMLLKSVTKHLRKICRPLQFHVLFFLRHPKVPIVKLAHPSTGLEVEIQSTNTAFNGLQYAKFFQREYPSLKGIFLVLRHAFRLRGLDIGPNGGITSYPLLNMVVAALQWVEARNGSLEPADHLLGFLDLFSDIDFASHGLLINPLKMLDLQENEGKDFIRQSGVPSQPSTMFLRDPADPSNNLGKAVTRIDDVQATIISMKEAMRDRISEWDGATEQSADNPASSTPNMSLLAPLLEADWRSFHRDRKLLTLHRLAAELNE